MGLGPVPFGSGFIKDQGLTSSLSHGRVAIMLQALFCLDMLASGIVQRWQGRRRTRQMSGDTEVGKVVSLVQGNRFMPSRRLFGQRDLLL